MTLINSIKNRLSGLFGSGSEPKRIGIYGPPNAGKSTLANRISRDWAGEELSTASEVPHETRHAERKQNVTIEKNGTTVEIDIVDTPGVDSKIDYEDFLDYGLEDEQAKRRAREAADGVSESLKWLREDIDGVLYVLDSTRDPVTQVNNMLVGIIESQDLPALILANKTDLEESDVDQIKEAFPGKEVVSLSALEGENMDETYEKIAETFG